MMFEFHLWVGLSDSTDEDDARVVRSVVERLRAVIAENLYPAVSFAVNSLNGRHYLVGTGHVQRRNRSEGYLLEELVGMVERELPGSWGLLYERDDEMPVPPGPNAFRVRVIARGAITTRLDPFLSPAIPLIED